MGTEWCLLCLLTGCVTTNSVKTNPNFEEIANKPSIHRPSTDRELRGSKKPFIGTLPLGIGASVDVFFSETSDNVGYFYNSVLKQYRSGHLFREQPYQLDYVVFPQKGDTFNHNNRWSDVSFKSDYDFKLGISRRFQDISDFFKLDFLLGKGRFSPVKEPTDLYHPLDKIPVLDEDRLMLPPQFMTEPVDETMLPPHQSLDKILPR